MKVSIGGLISVI